MILALESRGFKDIVYGQFARIGKVLSSPKRIELLDLLSQGPKSVENLALETQMSVANTSQHLQTLLDARLVYFEKEKNFVIYQLIDDKVLDLLSSLKCIAEENVAEINLLKTEFIRRPDHIETIDLTEFLHRMKNDHISLLDVRPLAEYEAGHLPGAISIPINELEKLVSTLPKDKKIIAYCRGPYCVYATEAVELLQSHGFEALLLEAGINEWKQANSTIH